MQDLAEIVKLLNDLGTLGLAILALVGFLRGWIVPKGIYDREVERGDKATDLAARQGTAIDRILTLLEARREVPSR